jgi:hypothetical protein
MRRCASHMRKRETKLNEVEQMFMVISQRQQSLDSTSLSEEANPTFEGTTTSLLYLMFLIL